MKAKMIYILLMIIIIGFIVFIGLNRPKVFDWSPSFSVNEKNPYGLYILKETLEKVNSGRKITVTDSSAYQVLKNIGQSKKSYIIITNSFDPDNMSVKSLLKWVASGNNAFIAAEEFPEILEDSLHFSSYSSLIRSVLGSDILTDSALVKVSFTNKNIDKRVFYFQRPFTRYYFSDMEKINSRVISLYEKNRPNLISVKYGDGYVFLSTFPYAYTNYNMLRGDNYKYAFTSLSKLLPSDIIFDNYYKPELATKSAGETPLKYILTQDSLKWAYYTGIISLLFFMAFSLKRRQRAIPIVVPYRNSTVEFIETLSNLYFHKPDHKKIAEKKIHYFFDFIRTKLLIFNNEPDDQLYSLLANKSGMDVSEIKSIFGSVYFVRQSDSITKDELMGLNLKIESFYKRVNYDR